MSLSIALPAAGEMGAGLGAVLSAHGARVLTITEGRSERSRARARDARMAETDMAGLASADIILSVVPPGIALQTAERIGAQIRAGGHAPLYIDANAVSPETARAVGRVVTEAGARFVDGSIIGPPPAAGKATKIYVSGGDAAQVRILAEHGLDIREMEGGIGAASALKMCYGGMTKGLTGLMAALMLAAEREGIGADLHAELGQSQEALLTRAGSAVPDMLPKAYRWVAEMDAIAEFVGEERGEHAVWRGLARLYDRLAEDRAAEGDEVARLECFLTR